MAGSDQRQVIERPTILILEMFVGEDFTPPDGYTLNEIKTSTTKGKGLFYAVCVKIPEGGVPKPLPVARPTNLVVPRG